MKKKIFLSFVILVVIAVFTTGIFAISLLETRYIKDIEEKLITNSKLIIASIKHEELEVKDLESLARYYSKEIDTRITFINKDGQVIADSEADKIYFENHRNRVEVKDAISGKIGISRRYSKSLGLEMLYVALPFESDIIDIEVIRLAVTLENIMKFNKTLIKYFIISTLFGIVVALLLGYRYASSITSPIKELTYVTKKLSCGVYGEKVYINTNDELGILADNFNTMSKKLKESIDELQNKNTEMKSILSSMINGVIALDNSKNVMFINPNVEEMFEIKEEKIKGKNISELIDNVAINDVIYNLLNSNIMSNKEIEIFEPKHKIFKFYSKPIRLESDFTRVIGTNIIIQDITEIRKLERIRKDFVANVSHEIKTPLTSIKGFVETLKDGVAEDENVRNKFLDIIDIEANRLNSLVEDLLLLSEIENKINIKNKVMIDTNKSISEILQVMEEIAKNKNIEIINRINNNLPKIHGNNGWFKQMMINLIDNSIKYTPSGGKVTITAYNTSRKLFIKISDTGIGIDKKHLSRLFERFYRVDKARTRQVGGTGLGLAIVKHIVLAFGGNINIKSEVNKGTEFLITIPVKN